jgi:hypothetical protein
MIKIFIIGRSKIYIDGLMMNLRKKKGIVIMNKAPEVNNPVREISLNVPDIVLITTEKEMGEVFNFNELNRIFKK